MRGLKRTWQEYVKDTKESLQLWEESIRNDTIKDSSKISIALHRSYKTLGINDLLEGNVEKFKHKVYNSALFAMYSYTEYGGTWYSSSFYPYALALMSDNSELINIYANMVYESDNRWIKTSYLNEIYQGLLTGNDEKVNKSVEILEQNISKKKELNLSKANHLCTIGILEENKDMILEGINIFEAPRQKSRLLKNERCQEVISMLPIIYLKIAKIRGFIIDFESPFIPKNATEISPLSEYHPVYDYLVE